LSSVDAVGNFTIDVPAATGPLLIPTSVGTAGQALISSGTAVPIWQTAGTGTVTSVSFTGGLISVATPTSTPALTVAGTSGGVPYFTSASTWASSAVLAANALMIGGGAGATPATTATGTGVVTALGTNIGTAGSFVLNGGVLGTPSSGTVTNLTGTASININGTVGATTPATVVATQVDITAQGDLRLQDTTGGEYVALQAPATIAASYTLTLPVDDGTAGQALVTDGSGVLSWSSAASGDVYGPASATDNAIARFDLTTGKIIQNSVVTIADTTGNMAGVGTLSSGAITSSALTAGRVPYAGTAGLIQDAAALTFDGTILSATRFAGALNGTVGATTPSTGVFTTLTDSGLTAGRVNYNGTGGLLVDSANLTFNGTTLTAAGFAGPISGVVTSSSITDSGLTSGRVTYAGTGGLLQDSANFTFNGTAATLAGQLNLTNASDYNLYASGAGKNYMAANLGIATTNILSRLSFPIGEVAAVQQAAVTDHLVGNVGSLGFGIRDGGGLSGLIVSNVFGGTFNSQYSSIFASYGGVRVSTEIARFNFDGVISLGAAPGSESLRVTFVASAVNYWESLGASTGVSPVFQAVGSDTNVNAVFATKGTGAHLFRTNGNTGNTQFLIANTASAVNYLQVTGSATGNRFNLSAQGSDTNVGMNFAVKGTENFVFATSAGTAVQFLMAHTASAVNYHQMTGSATGTAIVHSAQGSDTNIDLALTPKGTGVLAFGTHTAGIVAQSGYITIKDAGGTTRRLLVG